MGKDIEHFYAKYGVSQVRDQSYIDEFKELLEAVFAAEEKIQLIVFRGYTPSFNDGDPCRHSSGISVLTTDGLEDDDEIVWPDVEEHYDDTIENAVLLDEVFGVRLATPVSSHIFDSTTAISKKVDRVIYGNDLADIIYDTNYLVKVYRTANGITIEHKEYHCGW